MATIFEDNFDRANGPLGAPWQNVVYACSISAGKVTATDWGARTVTNVGVTDFKMSAVANQREWPILIFRYEHGGTYYCLNWGNPNLQLIRRHNSVDTVMATMPSPSSANIAMRAAVKELPDGAEITWGYDATTAVFKDTAAARPKGTYVGFELHPGRTFDNLLVETIGDVTTTTTTTTTTVPPTTTTTTTVPPLPTELVPGVTYGHLSHHARLHATAGITPATPGEGDLDHLHHHAQLKSWYDPAHETPLPVVVDAQSHAAAHEALHAWLNEPPTTTTTTTVGGGGFLAGDSILHPNYVGKGSVFQRDVSNMPLASNSAQMAAYMRQDQINTGYGTAFNLYEYNFPTYVVRSSQMTPAHMAWDHSWHGYPNWTMPEMMGTVFSKSGANPELNMAPRFPIPEYAVPAVGTDSSMAVYDADTDTLWEWWHATKLGVREWNCWWGSRTLNASKKYSGQADIGSVCAAGLMGSLLQIGVGEAQNGWIDHALGLVILAPKRGFSWPARQDDGWVDDVNAPTQGQWFRLNPSLNIDAQSWNPLLKMVCRAVQTFGATCFDKGGAVCWTGESGRYHQTQTGADPWTAILGGVPSWQVFHDFPWEQTQWAPIDWGKP